MMSYAFIPAALPHNVDVPVNVVPSAFVVGAFRPAYWLMRPAPDSDVNSAVSTPIFLSRQFSASDPPFAIAIRGMCPSLRLRGRCVSDASTGVSAHAATDGMVTARRHFPIWITRGMLSPTGTCSTEKRPAESVSAAAIGRPEYGDAHVSHVAPVVMSASGSFGT